MSGPVPFIDASLGRGLARQSVRRLDARLDTQLDRALAGAGPLLSHRPRPKQRLRENLQIFERNLRGLLVSSLEATVFLPDEAVFEPATVLLAWDVRTQETGFPRLALGNINLSHRTGDPVSAPLGAVIISEHALQRVFQRLRTTETRQALRELGDAAAALFMYSIRETWLFHCGQTCFAATPNGLAYAEIDVSTRRITITTWIDAHKLRPEQRALLAPGPAAAKNDIRFYSGAETLPNIGQVHATTPDEETTR